MALNDTPMELVVSAKSGDKQAMEDLIKKISPDIIRLIRSKRCNLDDAEDILQNSLIRIFRNIKSLKDESLFAAWVKKIAINQTYTFFTLGKKKKADTSSLEELEEKFGHNLDEVASSIWVGRSESIVDKIYMKEVFKILVNEFDKLPKRRKMAMFLFYTKDVRTKEVAEEMGVSEGAVKYHLHLGRKNLAASLLLQEIEI